MRGAMNDTLPIPSYDDLHEKDVIGRFRELSQVQLAEIEAYERSHRNRRVVLHKLRYMRSPEPVPGYDTLEPTEIDAQAAGGGSSSLPLGGSAPLVSCNGGRRLVSGWRHRGCVTWATRSARRCSSCSTPPPTSSCTRPPPA